MDRKKKELDPLRGQVVPHCWINTSKYMDYFGKLYSRSITTAAVKIQKDKPPLRSTTTQ